MNKRQLSIIPAIGAALLPNVTCPACWPIYAGILSAVGLGFLMTGTYFYILVSILLSISLFSLFYNAKTRRGYAPFALGLVSAIIILAGKYFQTSDYVLYVGAAILIAASIWNNIPKKSANPSNNNENGSTCPSCHP
ncbi:MAG: MerC domain-containing protein [FCB group bacterium]|nr:MerC domain-containing protein [FCB group bacterium]